MIDCSTPPRPWSWSAPRSSPAIAWRQLLLSPVSLACLLAIVAPSVTTLAAPEVVPGPSARSSVSATATAMAPATASAARAVDRPAALLPDFQRECERMIETTDLRGGRVGISVMDADSGRVFVDADADVALVPASNMKLLTSGTALHVLGPDFAFRTRLVRDGGRLVVLGDGDPGFGDEKLLANMPVAAAAAAAGAGDGADPGERGRELEVDALLDFWVRAVVDSGFTHVDELLVDDRIFDREYVHSTWPRRNLSRHYSAGVAGLNFHSNILTFYPRPTGRGGAAPGPSVPRAGFLEIENRATGDSSRSGNISMERRLGTDQLVLMGNVRVPQEYGVKVSLHDPPEFFARLLTERLRQAGIRVGAWRTVARDAPLTTGPSIAPDIVTPLVRILERTNTDSHNVSAEALFKRVAAARGQIPATFVGAAAMVRDVVRERVADERLDSRLRVVDGSGLSPENLVPPALITAWLRSFHLDPELAPVLRASMAVMGRTGTLDDRLSDAPPGPGRAGPVSGRYVPRGVVVRAKSGTISGVSGLSGYVIGPERTLCFSILINDFTGSAAAARDLQDRVVMLLAEGLAGEGRPRM